MARKEKPEELLAEEQALREALIKDRSISFKLGSHEEEEKELNDYAIKTVIQDKHNGVGIYLDTIESQKNCFHDTRREQRRRIEERTKKEQELSNKAYQDYDKYSRLYGGSTEKKDYYMNNIYPCGLCSKRFPTLEALNNNPHPHVSGSIERIWLH
jgi:hypothetical protein